MIKQAYIHYLVENRNWNRCDLIAQTQFWSLLSLSCSLFCARAFYYLEDCSWCLLFLYHASFSPCFFNDRSRFLLFQSWITPVSHLRLGCWCGLRVTIRVQSASPLWSGNLGSTPCCTWKVSVQSFRILDIHNEHGAICRPPHTPSESQRGHPWVIIPTPIT